MTRRLLYLCCMLSFVGCQKTDYTFCNLPAKFLFDNTIQAPALHTACNSMGEFCTITSDGKQFIFKGSAKEPSYVPITAIASYSGYHLGVDGLIVGLPNIPELGKTESQVVCFDWACSNCYEDYTITKKLTLHTDGTATCPRCKRTYNLNNIGFISDGEPGRALFRYRVSYVGYTLVVNN